eukprot:TRINITY_DN7947_c0_g1_i1.p1 TRINITY_DN7947_c0_g1~~TRINITY_DN7947_c0_g1_i1.p1  ORF type:complete len:420 (+),score=154.20 TRINITY_DN7947_c0_g1_i1:49-1308(+)
MGTRVQVFDVPFGHELKFESKDDNEGRVIVKVVEGSCECFGSALARDRAYVFPAGAKAALSAPQEACRVELIGHHATTVAPFSGVAFQPFLDRMNARRTAAAQRQAPSGPHILVVGQTDTGKSTLCKYLINSATRQGHSLSFVDADLGQNSITVPGSLASVFMDAGREVDVEEGFTLLPPLAFFFGDLTLNRGNLGKYQHLCDQIAACLKANAENRPTFQHGGVIVNTMGWIEDLGYEAIKMLVEALGIDTVVVMDNRQLEERIGGEFAGRVEVVGFERPQRVVTRNSKYRRGQRGERVKEYFRGVHTPLHPVKVVVPFSAVSLYSVGEAGGGVHHPTIPPYLRLAPVAPDVSLDHTLAAVSHATIPEEIPHANVAGFVVILHVDLESQMYTLLMPSGEQPPGKHYFITSKIKCTDADL